MHRTTALRGLTAIAAAAAVLQSAHPALAQVEVDDGKTTVSAQRIMIAESNGENEAIEIRVDGDKVRVVRNGKEVPQAQIIQDDGSIVITDKDGKQLKKLNVNLKRQPGELAYRYALGADTLRGLYTDENAKTPKVMLGVHMTAPGPALEKHLGLESGTTTLISGLYQNLPADEAGISEYDIITKIDGQSPADQETIRKALSEKEPGDVVKLTLIHEGKVSEVKVKLAAYDGEAMAKATLLGEGPAQGTWTGFITPDARQGMFFDPGNMPQVFVSPRENVEFKELIPGIQQFHAFGEASAEKNEQLEKRLQRLDDRLEQLERLLEKLAESREQTR